MESEEIRSLIVAVKNKKDDRAFSRLCKKYEGYIVQIANDLLQNQKLKDIKTKTKTKIKIEDLIHAGNMGIFLN